MENIGTKAVARHEAGHVMGLLAGGIYDEFTSVDIHPDVDDAGREIEGRTLRSGCSLTDFSARIQATMAWPPEKIGEAYRGFMLGNACRVCFPHVCYFAGGDAIQNCYCDDNEVRLVIDREEFCSKLVPAMGLGIPVCQHNAFAWNRIPCNPGDDDRYVRGLWNYGIGAVKSFIVGTDDLALRMAAEIERRGWMGRREMDEFLGGREKASELSRQFSQCYEDWLRRAEDSYRIEFDKRNPWVTMT